MAYQYPERRFVYAKRMIPERIMNQTVTFNVPTNHQRHVRRTDYRQMLEASRNMCGGEMYQTFEPAKKSRKRKFYEEVENTTWSSEYRDQESTTWSSEYRGQESNTWSSEYRGHPQGKRINYGLNWDDEFFGNFSEQHDDLRDNPAEGFMSTSMFHNVGGIERAICNYDWKRGTWVDFDHYPGEDENKENQRPRNNPSVTFVQGGYNENITGSQFMSMNVRSNPYSCNKRLSLVSEICEKRRHYMSPVKTVASHSRLATRRRSLISELCHESRSLPTRSNPPNGFHHTNDPIKPLMPQYHQQCSVVPAQKKVVAIEHQATCTPLNVDLSSAIKQLRCLTNEPSIRSADDRYTISELWQLYRKTQRYYAKSKKSQLAECDHFYRDKSLDYYVNIKNNKGGVMEARLKDLHGDPRSPINGRLHGVFFNVRTEFKTSQPPPFSQFGSRRLMIPVRNLIREDNKMYFADIYCTNRAHYVVLVITESGSDSDHFCQGTLPEIDIKNNPFFRVSISSWDDFFKAESPRAPIIEIFYTEDVNIADHLEAGAMFTDVDMVGPVRQIGFLGTRKNTACRLCNLNIDALF